MALAPGGGKKILGGCATVAGWGNRYSTDDMHDNQAKCMTDYSNLSPDKVGLVGFENVVLFTFTKQRVDSVCQNGK